MTCLLAAAGKESGAWINAIPVTSLGFPMKDEVLRIAVGLRIGAPLIQPYVYCHCCKQVDVNGTHGLSCRRSRGWPRHASECGSQEKFGLCKDLILIRT